MPEVTEYAPGPRPGPNSPPPTKRALCPSTAPCSLAGRSSGNGGGQRLVLPHAETQRPVCLLHLPAGRRGAEPERAAPWNIYFTVNNVDESVETIKRNGGTAAFGPMDVYEAGRMAFCQDPQGAFFAIWQAKQHIGAGVKDETGAMCWNELLTTDRSAAIEFYMAALGMERGEVAGPMDDYAMLKAGGAEVVGVMEITRRYAPDAAPLGRLLRSGGY